jgi:predicted phage baseplate assembly protein
MPLLRITGKKAGDAYRADQQSPKTWEPQADLLRSGPDDLHCVVEIDNEGRAHVRFGDDELAQRPPAEMLMKPCYRIGNGTVGNVGVESIVYVLLQDERWSGTSLRVRNPMPALGGTDPEPLVEAKLLAPHAFRHRLERAIIADDYATLAARHKNLQRAAAALRWTGSWYEAAVAVDPRGGETTTPSLLNEIAASLHRYRRVGHDLSVQPAEYVPLYLAMHVCVSPHYQRGHVEAALLDRFSNRMSLDGQPGFFHPDNLSFGDHVYLSNIIAAAQALPGVQSVKVTKLQRWGESPQKEIEQGLLKIGPMQIAQLENDPNFPEHGVLAFTFGGGR